MKQVPIDSISQVWLLTKEENIVENASPCNSLVIVSGLTSRVILLAFSLRFAEYAINGGTNGISQGAP